MWVTHVVRILGMAQWQLWQEQVTSPKSLWAGAKAALWLGRFGNGLAGLALTLAATTALRPVWWKQPSGDWPSSDRTRDRQDFRLWFSFEFFYFLQHQLLHLYQEVTVFGVPYSQVSEYRITLKNIFPFPGGFKALFMYYGLWVLWR